MNQYNYSNTTDANNLRFTEKKLIEVLLYSDDKIVVKWVPHKKPHKTKKYVMCYKFYVFVNDEPQGVMNESVFRKLIRVSSSRVTHEVVE